MSTPVSAGTADENTEATVTGLAASRAKARSTGARKRRSASKSSDKKLTSTDRVKMLAELGWETYDVGRTTDGQIFVTPRVGAPVARLLEAHAAELTASLALTLHRETGEVFSSVERREAMLTLSDKALDAEPVPTAVRIANPDPRSIAIDLGNDLGEYVLITRDGWRVTADRGRVAFLRGSSMKALPYPERGGDVSLIWQLMNIAEPARPLVLANWLTAMFKGADHPILSLTGQAGSAKTTTMGMYSYLLDPIEIGEGQGIKDVVIALPTDPRDIYVTASSRYFLPYDNIDRMTAEQQTALSIIATGGMRSARALYTDSVSKSIPVRGCLSLTAIDLGKLKPDFLDRIIAVEVDPIPGGVFRTPSEIMSQFDRIHPQILGGLFDLAVQVLARLDDVRRDMQRRRVRVARMADFSYILATVDQVMGTRGFEHFMRDRDERQAEIATSDPLMVALMALIDAQDKGEGISYTPTDLLAALTRQYKATAQDVYARPPKGWPETPMYLSRQINLLQIPLRDAGYSAKLVKANGIRRWHLRKVAETGTDSTSTSAAAPQQQPAPPPAVPPEDMSPQCRIGARHAECQRDRRLGWIAAQECRCPCHDGGGEPIPFTFPPDPDPSPEDIGPTAEDLAMLSEMDRERAAEGGIDPAIDSDDQADTDPEQEAEPEPPRQLYSARRITPWTVKRSAYVDLVAGEGITDAGETITIRKRGARASLAELLRAIPASVKIVHLTGADLGTASELMSWAHTRLPSGWTETDRAHDSDEVRDRVSLRYRRPDGKHLTVFRAANWIDRDHESVTSPADLRAAFALLLDGLRTQFGEVVGDDYGVPLKGSPAATGLELVRRTLPRDRRGEPHQFPILDGEIQHLIRAHVGQARSEDFAATTHPSGGAHVPDLIPGLYVYDMRFAYAALLDLELPTGPVIRDTLSEFARRGSGWEPCLYRVRVTVPAGWDRAGRFRCRDTEGRWIYPHEPGNTFECWTWERALAAGDRDGWRIGEHVQILERIRFTGPKVKPLATFGRALRSLRDEWIPAQAEVPERVRELGRIMARQIAIATIGKFAGTPHMRLRSCPIEDLTTRPADAWTSADGRRWEWREPVIGRDDLIHPEWSSYIWACCRDWLYDHPTQRGVGLRHVPLDQLIAARTDAMWTSTPQPVTDTGRVGHFRVQLAHDGELVTPRTYAALNQLRADLLAGGDPA